ncbi:hypothetical protein PoB_001255100 [Plakobranchus ocellatus]|uniref:Uncharacterized protein n=1 Tax=Plakobranchus ocellatus TaxID=259542 RepID=A0AAV3YFG0_9GAST|nr:hypothetical protein PoB_001255100 [Plakobranchus ocellatus]
MLNSDRKLRSMYVQAPSSNKTPLLLDPQGISKPSQLMEARRDLPEDSERLTVLGCITLCISLPKLLAQGSQQEKLRRLPNG